MENKTHKTSESLLSQWKSKKKSNAIINKLHKAPEDAVIPLSHGQLRLWFLQQLYPNNPFYNYSESFTFKGELNVDHLKKSFEILYRENDILRSYYPAEKGRPILKVNQDISIHFKEFDLLGLGNQIDVQADGIMRKQATTRFDLSKPSLVRISLIKLGPASYKLFITMHHIIIDAWSIDILKEKLADYYTSFNSGIVPKFDEEKIQFSDYSYWQQQSGIDEKQLNYWKDKLSGEIPILNIPTDYKRPLKPRFKGKQHIRHFSDELSKVILNFTKKHEVTPFVFLLSVYYIFLHKYTGQKEIIVGSPISNRSSASLHDVLGFFIDTTILKCHLDINESFTNFLKKVRKTTLEAFTNKDIPFDVLVKEFKLERSLAVNPFFQVMFLYNATPSKPSFGTQLQLLEHSEFDTGVAKFDLTMFIGEDDGQLWSTLEYDSDLFEERTIERFQEQYVTLIKEIIELPDEQISKFQMITVKEKEFFFRQEVTDKKVFEKYKGIHQIIEDRVKESPTNIALSFGDTTMTYDFLNRKAEAIARAIVKETGGSNDIVGLCANRSLDMIVGIMSILKAGCAYLPIDPEYPLERTNYILSDSEVNVILTQKLLNQKFEDFNGVSLFFEDEIIKSDNFFELPEICQDDFAYVIYTSGSTGEPKGVPISHRNIINSTQGRVSYYPENPTVFLLLSSISFDSSKAGIFWTLCTGGNLVISAKHTEQDIHGLAKIIERNKVSHTLMLPTLYNLLLEYAAPNSLNSLVTVILAGEVCTPALVKRHFNVLSKVTLYNEYGPTEGTVWCTAHKILPQNSEGNVPIGKPVAKADIYLLDENLLLVPYGAIGDIYIGGPGLSSGYLNKPELTKNAYFDNPFSNIAGDRIYKTGDRGRYNQNGNIEFLGREDDQVKIRGFRIDLGEIENSLLSHEMVNEAVVLFEKLDFERSKHLVSFLIINKELDSEELKLYLKKFLPDYMIPSVIIPISEFPALPNGKLDKNSLLKLKRPSLKINSKKQELPRTDIEKKLMVIWKEILGISDISINDNFFDIGGDSILSIQMLNKARQNEITLSPNQIFEYQTIKELANFIARNDGQNDVWDFLVPFRKEGAKKPLFCLHAGGGHVFFYKGLVDFIDPERPLYAVQAAGAYGNQKMHSTIPEMAQDYIKAFKSVQSKGPYNILVYCFSVTVGHEIAMQLKNSNEECNLIVMDTMAKPWTLNTPNRLKIRLMGFYKRLMNKPLYTLNQMASIRLNSIINKTHKVIGNKEQKKLEELRANLAKLSFTYEWKPFNGKISLILTQKAHESLNHETIHSWKEFASGGIKVLKTKGNHVFLFENDNLPHLAKKIEDCIPESFEQ